MATLDVLSLENKKVGTVNVSDDVFASKVNVALVHQVLKAQLAARRQGTACTKTKGEVRGGGRKPFKQKGTGNARQGSTRSPLQPGGGTAHGPKPRSYVQATNKKMVQGALRSALSDRNHSSRLLVVDQFDFKAPKTKELTSVLKKLNVSDVLIIDEENKNLFLSGANMRKTKVIMSKALNVYDIIDHEWVVLSKKSAEELSQRLSSEEN